ncbi:MAG: hypothetical protein LBL67_06195 [Coriobacteriales bacterium]|nr:hypothetical protein [Coriobacteriales bacterium]
MQQASQTPKADPAPVSGSQFKPNDQDPLSGTAFRPDQSDPLAVKVKSEDEIAKSYYDGKVRQEMTSFYKIAHIILIALVILSVVGLFVGLFVLMPDQRAVGCSYFFWLALYMLGFVAYRLVVVWARYRHLAKYRREVSSRYPGVKLPNGEWGMVIVCAVPCLPIAAWALFTALTLQA